MNKKHQPFTAHDGTTVHVISSCGSIHMGIPNQKGYTYITKQEAMDFFGLMEKPEPEKPFYADLIKLFTEGAEIEYRRIDGMSNMWEPLKPNSDDRVKYALLAFMDYERDPEWAFRIKPE